MNRWVEVLRFSGIGFWIGGCIAGGLYLGDYVGDKVGPYALFILLGLGFGLFLAFVGTYRMLLSALGDRWGKRKGGS
ncbi:MAG: hypothetical protein KAX23_03010 [Dehalococcoidia bacterium]|nr:hypothetical protein [Chloroflexota bacterium]MCK4242501.1 hypothetical protein [Dehalococcoidia bacterium]